jgi:hypothetical protein
VGDRFASRTHPLVVVCGELVLAYAGAAEVMSAAPSTSGVAISFLMSPSMVWG